MRPARVSSERRRSIAAVWHPHRSARGLIRATRRNSCSGYPTSTCTTTLGAAGIRSDAYFTRVQNGFVVGMAGTGISLNDASSSVDNVRVLSNGKHGIYLLGAGRVTRSVSIGNYGSGILLDNGGTAEANEARANREYGIYLPGPLRSTAIANLALSKQFRGHHSDRTRQPKRRGRQRGRADPRVGVARRQPLQRDPLLTDGARGLAAGEHYPRSADQRRHGSPPRTRGTRDASPRTSRANPSAIAPSLPCPRASFG